MRKLYCSLMGHDLKVSKNITFHIKEYQCQHCKEKFTTSSTGYIAVLTKAREEANLLLEHIYSKRLKRKGIRVNS